MQWFFLYWRKFRKAKSYSVILVKNRCDHLVNETLKSAEWIYELNWFCACWIWCNHFWLDQHTLYLWLINVSLLQLYLLDPWRQLEDSYEMRSVHPSLLTSVWVFSWDWNIRFLWSLRWWQKAQFFGKTFFAPKVGEIAKNRVFWI